MRNAGTFALLPMLPPAQELERVVRAQLAMARQCLGMSGEGLHDAIHDARRAIRRVRASLQLLRPSLGKRYAEVVAPLRSAGRILSPLRDAQSAMEALEALARRADSPLTAAAKLRLAKLLRQRRTAVLADGATQLKDAEQALAHADADVAIWTEIADLPAMVDGLRLSYRRARRAMRVADRHADDESLHRFRQRTRTHWLQMTLLQPSWPAAIGAQAEEAKRLSQLLGGERDLWLLAQRLGGLRRPLASDCSTQELSAYIDRRRHAMRDAAFALGALLFSETPNAFAQRMDTYTQLAAQTTRSLPDKGD